MTFDLDNPDKRQLLDKMLVDIYESGQEYKKERIQEITAIATSVALGWAHSQTTDPVQILLSSIKAGQVMCELLQMGYFLGRLDERADHNGNQSPAPSSVGDANQHTAQADSETSLPDEKGD